MELKQGQTWENRAGHRVQVITVHANGNALVGAGQQVYSVKPDGLSLIRHEVYDLVRQVERVYIAGPMTGLPDLNFPAFANAAADYRSRGCHVENPAEINPDPTMPWEECMRRDIPCMLTCDTIIMLPGWRKSRGANIELNLAVAVGMAVVYPNEEV